MLEETQISEALTAYENLKNKKIEQEKREIIFKTLLRTHPQVKFSEIGMGRNNVITEIMYILSYHKKIALDLKNFK